MKIAVNTRLLVPEKMDGIGWFTYETIKIISKKHPEHEFVLIFDRKIPEKFEFGQNVILKSLSPQARIPILWTIWFQFSLPRYLKKIKADVLLSPEGWIPLKLNIPSLAVIHDLNFEHHPENIIPSHRKYLLKYFPKFARTANRIATVSKFSKEDIANTYNIPPEKVDVVYNGVSEKFQPLPSEEIKKTRKEISDGAPYFIFVGTLHPRKNLENLFKAFELFKQRQESSYKLVVAGNKKWWPKKLENLYRNLNFQKDIIFTGRLSEEGLAKAMAAATALIYVPHFEGFGIPILEAMKSEIPIICSNTSSMPEVAGEAAVYCDPFDEFSIEEAMKKLIESPTLRNDLVLIGCERVHKFSWEKTADLLWESLEKTMQS